MTRRRLIALNLILLAVIVSGVIRLRHDAQAFSAEHRIDQIQPESDKPLAKAVNATAASTAQEWPDIAAHNPFSFDRNDIAVVVSASAAQKPRRPKPILFGTIMFGKDYLAMLAPGDSPTRSSLPVHSGEVFDGWTVVEIKDKTITVKFDDVKETLIMNDPTAQVARVYEKTGTSGPAVSPVTTVNPSVPAPVPQAPSANPTTTPVPGAPRQIYTPFGMKTLDDSSK